MNFLFAAYANKPILQRMSDFRHAGGGDSPLIQASSASQIRATQAIAAVAEVEHTAQLSKHLGSLCLNAELADVTFLVDSERLPAHRVILAARSEYFRALLFGGMREQTESVIELKETPLVAFKALLKYIYTSSLSLSGMKEELILEVLGLAHRYAFTQLQEAIADYLKATLTARNVCGILNMSQLFGLQTLTEACFLFADRNACQLLSSQAFLCLSASGIEKLIARDSFCAPEIDIFRAIRDWHLAHPECTTALPSLVGLLRLPLISLDDLLNVVRPSGLLGSDTILDAIKEQSETTSGNLAHRGFLVPDVNIATSSTATVIAGECPNALLLAPESSIVQDGDRVFTRHEICDKEEEAIIIEFNHPYIINRIGIVLLDREPRVCSYYVEVSMDCKDWVRIVDFTKYLCRSRQNLLFRQRAVKYIKFVGTHNSVSRVFPLVSVEAMLTSQPFEIDTKTGLIIPSSNVAMIEKSALVIEGVSRCRNALLNGEITNYDWDNGYTCHQLGSGAITIQLPQPYMISSMRLLLWDCDERYYSYYIEVSTNQSIWKRVVDRQNEECRAWQYVEFDPEPVVFIRIVGTHNSANEVFHCVHLECPANPPAGPMPANLASIQPPATAATGAHARPSQAQAAANARVRAMDDMDDH